MIDKKSLFDRESIGKAFLYVKKSKRPPVKQLFFGRLGEVYSLPFAFCCFLNQKFKSLCLV